MPRMLRKMPTPASTTGVDRSLMAADSTPREVAAATPSAAVARIDM